ncbi:MAG: (2Fe-2S) ferredoxin domain-containing protein [Leptolyngbyaceae cyanobacterium SM2_5_2]|nr:(2Fe-2S) ferredoxin domain-containing protein [Leptolyngbyaceae cyanobacterium SM2_5_2]
MDASVPKPHVPQGRVLRGQYLEPLRSSKGKIKGLVLNTPEGLQPVKLPKYLRPMLVRELRPGSWVQVWAFPEEDRWRGINLIPWPEPEVPLAFKTALANPASQPVPPTQSTLPTNLGMAPVCIQVCRKGSCFKQGGHQVWSSLQAEVEANPGLQHVTIEATGCMKACKQGPNLRVLPHGKMHSQVTPGRALTLLSGYQSDSNDSPRLAIVD